MNQPRIGITPGHAGGVGYEVILKAFSEPALLELCQAVVYGNVQLAEAQRQALGLDTPFQRLKQVDDMRDGRLNVLDSTAGEVPLSFGADTPEGIEAERVCRERALADCREGVVDAVVHAPTNTPLLAQKGEMLMLVGEQVRLACATTAAKADEVPALLSVGGVVASIKQFNRILRRDFGLTRPRIAVLSLHDDDQAEETDTLMPAIEQAIGDDLNAFGPFPADEFFAEGDYRYYDGVLALHRQQADHCYRALNAEYGVYYLADGDIVQTATLQLAQLKTAGKGVADIQDFTHCIYLASDVLRHRVAFDEAYSDPLQKLYHDKRRDSDRPNIS